MMPRLPKSAQLNQGSLLQVKPPEAGHMIRIPFSDIVEETLPFPSTWTVT
jgi:hypothetical protein